MSPVRLPAAAARLAARRRTRPAVSLEQGPENGDFAAYVEQLSARSGAAGSPAAAPGPQAPPRPPAQTPPPGQTPAPSAPIRAGGGAARRRGAGGRPASPSSAPSPAPQVRAKAGTQQGGPSLGTLIKWAFIVLFVLPWLVSLLIALLR